MFYHAHSMPSLHESQMHSLEDGARGVVKPNDSGGAAHPEACRKQHACMYKRTNVTNMAHVCSSRANGLREFTRPFSQFTWEDHAASRHSRVDTRAHARLRRLHHARKVEYSHAMAPACGRSFLSGSASPRYFSTSSLAACSRSRAQKHPERSR